MFVFHIWIIVHSTCFVHFVDKHARIAQGEIATQNSCHEFIDRFSIALFLWQNFAVIWFVLLIFWMMCAEEDVILHFEQRIRIKQSKSQAMQHFILLFILAASWINMLRQKRITSKYSAYSEEFPIMLIVILMVFLGAWPLRAWSEFSKQEMSLDLVSWT